MMYYSCIKINRENRRQAALTIFLLLFSIFTGHAQNFGVSSTHALPDSSAMLDVSSTSKGVLIPRVALTSTTDVTTVPKRKASLLIYNTAIAGDVTPGYYYWTGLKWNRLIIGTDNRQTYVKTASCTLLKSETRVYTYGSLDIYLPAVTAADDGLEISIKNKGIYKDLLMVYAPPGGSIDSLTIPGPQLSMVGKTYVAHNGKWYVKEKITREDNVYDVSAISSFHSIAEVFEFLSLHMTGPSIIRMGGGTYPITSTITVNLSYPVTIRGGSLGETTVTGSGLGGSAMFNCQTECYFKFIKFVGPGTSAGSYGINLSASAKYHEIKDCSFDNFDVAVMQSNANELWTFDMDFYNCNVGIKNDAGGASGATTKVSQADFYNCAQGISLNSGVNEAVSIQNCSFYNGASGVGIYYNPASFTSYSTVFITSNVWNGIGSFYSGFDFTRADGRDANIIIINNTGVPDKRPQAYIAVVNNASGTTVTTTGNYYKAQWTNTSTTTQKFTIANNRITYQPNNKRAAWAVLSGNVSANGANRVVDICIIKNGQTGTKYGSLTVRLLGAGDPVSFATAIIVDELAPTDYLEVFVTSSTSGDVVTFQDVQWLTDTH